MRTIKEILRLWLVLSLPYRRIETATGAGRGTIAEYIRRAQQLDLSWQQIEHLTESQLEERLFGNRAENNDRSGKPMPDWAEVDGELRNNKSVTLLLLWQEYRQLYPEGYSYSQFHFHFSRWKRKQGIVMRQQHRAGEKLFLDYCDGPRIVLGSGEHAKTQIFVAVWGASNYTFAHASFSQDLGNWTKSHVCAFEYFGCVPQILVPDNLRSAVSRACRYEPDLNPTYHELGVHYGAAIIPARPRKARDKAKVEAGVLLVQRWILAVLRKRTFGSLADLNVAIGELLEKLNSKMMRRVGKSRKEMFESLDKPAALPLPATRYEYATWRKATVGLDYHIRTDNHFYSVPFELIGKEVHIRISANTVEVFFKGNRAASHIRSNEKGGTTTLAAHMPKSHREYATPNAAAMRNWAESVGPSLIDLFEAIWKKHNGAPSASIAFRGIYRLASIFGTDRIEKAAKRAVAFGSCSYTSMKRILSSGLDEKISEKDGSRQMLPVHENIRGSHYYKEENSIC
jgi:transposase